MQIDKHISALLYEHDCVIVPDFGGFVTSYAPAKVHVTQHVFNPPHKNISFNKHLKSNDGLLAHQIVHAESKTFSEATSIISSFVTECNGTLKRGEKISIEQVGVLSLDVEHNIQFEPDNTVNYLIGAFGMTDIQSLPIKRESLVRHIEKQFVDRQPIPQEIKKKKTFAYAVTAVALLIASSLILLSVQPGIIKNINNSSFNPFGEPINSMYTGRPEIKPALSVTDLSTPKFSLPINDTIALTSIAFVNDVDNKLIVRINENVPVTMHQPDKTAVASMGTKSMYGLKFHVVSGCFKIEANANNFIAMLKAKNLHAAIIGKNRDGLFIVSCGDYARKEEAYDELARLRSANTQAWMLEQ